ncbi:MAG: D-aminoacyl-tRNA deacylase [Succinatimonas hippei]|nr:D-aminoacyl-tRNA deacylase [Succinatimonas hippei]
MLALIQRVNFAKVVVEGTVTGEIQKGILAFIGFEKGDDEAKAKKMFDKLLKYRIFYDENEKMNLNLVQVDGAILLVSQFTLAANTEQGNRPSFDPAMPPTKAKDLYDKFIKYAHNTYQKVQEGQFGADMKVSLENDGPVTFMLKM